MALTGYIVHKGAAADTFTAATTTAKIKALAAEALQTRKRLAALDETYVTDDDITKNDTIENTEL